MVPKGSYMGRAVAGEFGTSSKKKTEFVALQLRVEGGPHDGEIAYYNGYFSGESTKRVVESLKYCGCTFPGNDITNLDGLGTTVVPFVVEEETYTTEQGETKTRAKVAWINNPNGGVSAEQKMDDAAKAAFKAKMLGTVANVLGANGTKKEETKANVPF